MRPSHISLRVYSASGRASVLALARLDAPLASLVARLSSCLSKSRLELRWAGHNLFASVRISYLLARKSTIIIVDNILFWTWYSLER